MARITTVTAILIPSDNGLFFNLGDSLLGGSQQQPQP